MNDCHANANHEVFIELNDAINFFLKNHKTYSRDKVTSFVMFCTRCGIISCLEEKGLYWVLKTDLFDRLELIKLNCINTNAFKEKIVRHTMFQEYIQFSKNTFALVTEEDLTYVEYAILHNLVLISNNSTDIIEPASVIFSGIEVNTASRVVLEYLLASQKKAEAINNNRISFFANSAYYMGCKKNLASFIVESISLHKNDCTPIFDLMCGSGAVSSSFSLSDDTYASDAQEFCTTLATIQAGGISDYSANHVINILMPHYHSNLEALYKLFNRYLSVEDDIFHMEYDKSSKKILLDRYITFVNETYKYESNIDLHSDNIYNNLISERKLKSDAFPYCLFSTYFANIYFGFLQAIHIDSLRYAINQIHNPAIKNMGSRRTGSHMQCFWFISWWAFCATP